MNCLRRFPFRFCNKLRCDTVRNMATSDRTSDGSASGAPNIIEDKEIFSDRPPGPLDRYRRVASFDWRKFTLLLETEQCLRFRQNLFNFLEENPVFSHSLDELTLDEKRKLSVRRQNQVLKEQFITLTDHFLEPDIVDTYFMTMLAYDSSASVKASLSSAMFPGVLRSMGNERLAEYAEAAEAGEITGAFALTEFSHGSNALGMRTTAKYDVETKQFILHSPDFEAAKCWVGNLGKACTFAIVYAQLYTPDGEHHGLNAFMVPIRDRKTLQPFGGVVVGDLGEKIGLNGVDNGFVMFNQYRIPKDFLLARNGDISDDGQFVSPIKDKKKRIGASFGALSGGRVKICGISNTYLTLAISIALRYSASRKQFKDDNDTEELPVLEYQSQQYRLLPHLATAVVQKVFSTWLLRTYAEFSKGVFIGEDVPHVGMEIHALSSAAKPVCTWAARDGIQDCREATGGHGYLKVARFGDLRNDNDPNCTYEGENNVLLQQTSNWLLAMRRKGYSTFKEVSPLGSAQFLANFDSIIKQKFQCVNAREAVAAENILKSFDWLVASLLESTYARSNELKKKSGATSFVVRNEIQVFYAQNLSIVFGQRTIFDSVYKYILQLEDSPERRVLQRLHSLYGANLLLKHLSNFYEGGYMNGHVPADLIKSGVLDLLKELKNDSISIVDAIAPKDFVLNSPLGMSDGEVYKHLQSVLWQTAGTFERPEWWQLVTHWKHDSNKSKL